MFSGDKNTAAPKCFQIKKKYDDCLFWF